MDGGAWWAAVHGLTKSQTRLSDFPFTFHFHALEKEMATPSSVLAWRIPGTGAWWAAVYGVAQSRTRLKRLSSSSIAYHPPKKLHPLPESQPPPRLPLNLWVLISPLVPFPTKDKRSLILPECVLPPNQEQLSPASVWPWQLTKHVHSRGLLDLYHHPGRKSGW